GVDAAEVVPAVVVPGAHDRGERLAHLVADADAHPAVEPQLDRDPRGDHDRDRTDRERDGLEVELGDPERLLEAQPGLALAGDADAGELLDPDPELEVDVGVRAQEAPAVEVEVEVEPGLHTQLAAEGDL